MTSIIFSSTSFRMVGEITKYENCGLNKYIAIITSMKFIVTIVKMVLVHIQDFVWHSIYFFAIRTLILCVLWSTSYSQ